jgi:hypothetical protein
MVGWWAVNTYINDFVYPGGPCSDDEARLTEQLGGDVMLSNAPPNTKLDESARFQPCTGWGSNYWGGAFVTRSYTSKPPAGTEVIASYLALGKATGWRMTTDRRTGDLCGRKMFGARPVTFNLTFQQSSPPAPSGYTTSLLYPGQQQPVNECIE